MKRIIAILLMLVAFVSCNVDKEKEYIFQKMYQATATVSPDDFHTMTAYVKSLDYFKAPSKYFGTYAEVSEKATNDFLAACEQIDESMIVPLLRVGEAFNILLYIDGMGTVVCGITINAEPEYNSENEE